MLTAASGAIARVRGPREITAAIPWQSGALWLSGSVLLADEVLYAVSAVSGPVAIIGLAYGCVPILVPILSRLAGTDRAGAMRTRHWVCLALAFAGNAMVFLELQAANIHFTMAAVWAFLAGSSDARLKPSRYGWLRFSDARLRPSHCAIRFGSSCDVARRL
jgi:drug/metabolite transporter (DMT)-like permease